MGYNDITITELEPLVEELNQIYDGNLHSAVDRLDLVLYMLFYVDQDVINFVRIQDTAYEITLIRNCIKKIQQNRAPQDVKLIPIGVMGVS